MQVTGNQLRAALNAVNLMIAMRENEFEASLKQFPGEDKRPLDVDRKLSARENQMVRLQEAQARYNLAVTVEVQGERMTLTRAVKAIGPAGRAAKRWRNALPSKNRYRFDELTSRDKDAIVEAWTLPPARLAEEAARHAAYAAALQAAIAAGNATQIDVEGLTEADLQV